MTNTTKLPTLNQKKFLLLLKLFMARIAWLMPTVPNRSGIWNLMASLMN